MTHHRWLHRRLRLACALLATLVLAAACGTEDTAAPPEPAGDDPVVEETTDDDATDDDATDDAADSGETYTLRFATYQVPGGALARAHEDWAADLAERTDGRVEVEFYWQGALLEAPEIMPGVQDGRADIGYVVPSFHPAELPLSNVVNTLFITSNTEAQAHALQHLYDNDEAFREEFTSQGLHLLFVGPVGPNLIMSSFPIESLEDMRGRQIRAIGYVQPALSAIGGNPIAISQGEVYESLQRGVIEATSGADLTIATDFNYEEVATHFVDPGFGQYAWVANVINADLWQSMPDDIRQAITEASEGYLDLAMHYQTEVEDESCQTVLDAGAEVSRLPDAEIAEWEEMVRDDLIDTWKEEATAAGAPAEEFWQAYTEALEQFEGEFDTYRPALERCMETAS